MHLASESPANRGVLEYLTRHQRGRNAPPIEPWNAGSGSTWQLGSHPDIVEHLWEVVAARLPAECRALVHGTPALVSPESGTIFAVALGIQYSLRLPPAEFTLARAAGVALVHVTTLLG